MFARSPRNLRQLVRAECDVIEKMGGLQTIHTQAHTPIHTGVKEIGTYWDSANITAWSFAVAITRRVPGCMGCFVKGLRTFRGHKIEIARGVGITALVDGLREV